jgi:uncharacterized 2Fe-2S/4Fe-4S cluster protein (DUF4445 family)
MDPATVCYFVEVAEPDMHEPSGDLERLAEALQRQWGIDGVTAPLSVLRKLQPVLRKGNWAVTVALHKGHRDARTASSTSGPAFHEGRVYGLAIDLGSTTIAAHLTDLRNGTVKASRGRDEPADPLWRGSDEPRLLRDDEPRRRPRNDPRRARGDQRAGARSATEAGIEARDIIEAVFVCNPVMHHLLLGIDPVELGRRPSRWPRRIPSRSMPRELGLTTMNPAARVFVLPCIAGPCGGRCRGRGAVGTADKSDDLVLIVDVGTNAEILLGNRSRVLACSSPTGPAFEGAQISAGQRAAPGAIERVEIDPVTKEPRFRVIGCDLWSDEEGFAEATVASASPASAARASSRPWQSCAWPA